MHPLCSERCYIIAWKHIKNVHGAVLILASSLSINAESKMGDDKYFNVIQITLGLVEEAPANNNALAHRFRFCKS
jgi:hypothetical protein